MNWYYADAGRQAGPVDDTQLDALIGTGKVTADTLVWREGMANWQPLREARPVSAAAPPAAAGAAPGVAPTVAATAAPTATFTGDEIVCAECGKLFSRSSAIQYGNAWVCATCKPVFLQKVKEGAVAPMALAPGTYRYAGFWIRFAAKFIDGLVLLVVLAPLYILLFVTAFRSAGRGQPDAFALLMQLFIQAAQILISLGYNTFFLGKYGATLGKMACGLRVIMPTGEPLSYPRALGRAAAEILSGLVCYIGYIIAAFDNEKRALHDHMASTRVVYK